MNLLFDQIKLGKKRRLLEAHSAISAMIVENSSIYDKNGGKKEFDGVWVSSLTLSLSKGLPDIELVDITSKLNLIQEIRRISNKPIIVDCDTGSLKEQFGFIVNALERGGVSAIVIEDKFGYKQNSLIEENETQKQESVENFCDKIRIGVRAMQHDTIGIVARIESFILGKGLDDALFRAKAYINAGASGILIHSKDKSADKVIEFAKVFKVDFPNIPLFCVPSKFNSIADEELFSSGFDVVIHANHLLRAAYPAMLNTAKSILQFDRSYEAGTDIMEINDILNLIPDPNVIPI